MRFLGRPQRRTLFLNLLEQTRELLWLCGGRLRGSETQADSMRRWRELPRPCKKAQERGTLEFQIEIDRPGHPSGPPVQKIANFRREHSYTEQIAYAR